MVVAPMLPTDLATVGLLPNVGAAGPGELATAAAGVDGGAAGPVVAIADGDDTGWLVAFVEVSRWTGDGT